MNRERNSLLKFKSLFANIFGDSESRERSRGANMGNNCCFRSRPGAVNHHNSDTTTKSRSPETEREDREENGVRKNISERKEGGLEREANTSTITAKKIMPSSGRIITPNLKIFTLAELKSATRNFRPDTVLGEGGFGRVFRGWVDDKTYAPSRPGVGMAVAVKKSNPDSSQGLEEWQAEVKFLGKFSHPNLVKLLGYCWEESHFLLVYEYMQKGSLESHLFRQGGEPLSWETRLKIAIEAAKGLHYLHDSEKSVIYRDFKASNILLDGAFHAKLSDFGLAKFGPINGNSHITTRVMGTYGYAAPEYVATGHLYVKSDVYGFGVVLLEILTGLRALDTNRPPGKHNLVEWANPSLSSRSKLKKIMDQRLEKNYPIKGAMKAGELILKCLEGDPKNRPSMKDVLDDLLTISEMKEKSKEKSNVRGKDKAESHQRPPVHRKHGGKDIPYNSSAHQYRS